MAVEKGAPSSSGIDTFRTLDTEIKVNDIAREPPVAIQRPITIEAHGDKRIDPWYWLNDASNPKVLRLLEKENEYTQSVLEPLSNLRNDIYQEIAGRTPQTDCSAPVRHGKLWRFARTVEGSSYPVYCAIPVSAVSRDLQAEEIQVLPEAGALYTTPEAGSDVSRHCLLDAYTPPAISAICPAINETLLLDGNVLAQKHEYMAIGDLETAETGNLLAYSVDTSGKERFTLYIEKLFLDAPTGTDAPAACSATDERPVRGATNVPTPYPIPATIGKMALCVIDDISYGLAFDRDLALYYVRADNQNRPYQVWRHLIDASVDQDTLLYEEHDERFFVDISRTRDSNYLLIESRSKRTSEIRAVRLGLAGQVQDPIIIQARQEGVEYTAEHYQGWFILLTNDSAPDFRIV
ncbi:MAG: S9 family peptidase, partial [Acidimicrobiales bacterium]